MNSIVHHKRNLLKEIPYFEARARASALPAVVQDYLLASVHHLGHAMLPHHGFGSQWGIWLPAAC